MKPEDQAQQLNRPAYFYKYKFIDESCQKHSERIFTHNELYFCAAKNFNDPFECKFRFALGGSPKEQMKYWEYLLRENESELNRKARRSKIRKDKERLMSPDFMKEIEDKANQAVREQWGICCLTKVKDDILMWSHYANKHQGFCLIFSMELHNASFTMKLMREGPSQEQIITSPLEVEYSKNYPFAKRLQDDLLKQTILTKAKRWDYEKEWRMIIKDGVGLWQFPPQYLTGVIFGCRMSEKHQEKIRGWCKDRQPAIKYYEAQQREDSYLLNIVEIS